MSLFRNNLKTLKRRLKTFYHNPHLLLHVLYEPIDYTIALFARYRTTKKLKKEKVIYGPYRLYHLPKSIRKEFKKEFKLIKSRIISHRAVIDGRNKCHIHQVPAICRKHMPYVNDNYEKRWPKEMIEELRQAAERREDFSCECYPYSVAQHYKALNKIEIQGSRAMVYGSISPWIESILLAYGAASVDTIEYGAIECNHPDINGIDRFKDPIPENGSYDLVCSFSSIEHSGLGRYGDMIDPKGDLKSMEEIRQLLTKHGIAMIGVPVSEINIIENNGHRLYSKDYLQNKLFKGFSIIDIIPFPIEANAVQYEGADWQNQPLFVLKKNDITYS